MDIGDYLLKLGPTFWLAIAAATIVAIYANRNRMFWVTDLVYTFPFIGNIRRFSHDYAPAQDGWLNVERTLCRDYAKHISALSREEFNNHCEYLRKTYDHGRKPMPAWVFVALAILIGAEALGFSYLLGSLMSLEGSENIRTLLMYAIVTVLAGILLWVTHAAGHQLYRTNLLRDIFKQHQVDSARPFCTRVVKLSEPQSIDDDMPAHIQCANRITTRPSDRGSYSWLWVALAFIAVIAAGSTALRVYTLQGIEAEALSAPAYPGAEASTEQAPSVEEKEAAAANHNAAISGFVVLGVIFFVTQLVGMRVGYHYGFVGLQSREAYRATGGIADYATYWSSHQHRIDIANLRLNRLHQLLEAGAPRQLDFPKTFLDFIREERKNGASHLQEPPVSYFDEPPPTAPMGPIGPDGPSGPNAPHRGPTLVRSSDKVDRVMSEIRRARSDDAKFEILESLDEVTLHDLEARLAAKKAAEEQSEVVRERLRERFAGLL